MLDVTILECSLHNTLWQPPLCTTHTAINYTRNLMLQRLLVASQTFARTLLGAPSTSLHRLTVPVWSGWFYATLLVVKVVLLRQNETVGSPRVNLVPHTVGDFLPKENGGSATADICKMTSTLARANIRDETTMLQETELVSIFRSFIKKLKATAPRSDDDDCGSPAKPFLMKVATLQTGLLSAVEKMAEHQQVFPATPDCSQGSCEPAHDSTTAPFYDSNATAGYQQSRDMYDAAQMNASFDPLQPNEPLNFAYFDNLANPSQEAMQQPPVDGWLWDLVMNDANMFSL
jgi:hypothetical protein